MPEFLLVQWRSAMLDAAARAFILFLAAGAVTLVLRRAPAAARHQVWQLALGGCLALPFLSLLLPAWQISVPQGALPASPLRAMRMPARTALPRTIAPDRRMASVAGGSHAEWHSSPSPVASSAAVVNDHRSPQAGVAAPLVSLKALFLLWLAGAVLLLIRALASLLQLHRIRRRCRRITAAPVLALAGQLAREAGLKRPVTLLHGLLDGPPALPMTWGFRRPVVLLPTGFAAWPEARQRAVLLHELAHIQRGDWLAQRLAGLTCALYWFHPLVWWAARRLRIESEQACDDQVLAAGVKPSDYAGHLLEIVRTAQRSRGLLRAAVSMARGPHLEERLRAVLDGRSHRAAPSRRASTLAWGAAAGMLLPLAAARVTARTPHVTPRPAPAAVLAAPVLTRIAAVSRIELCRIHEIRVAPIRRRAVHVPPLLGHSPSETGAPPPAARSEEAALSPPTPPILPVPAVRPAAAMAARPAAPAAAAVPRAAPLPADQPVADPAPAASPRAAIVLAPVVRTAVTPAFAFDFPRRRSMVMWAAEREPADRREERSEEPNLADQDLSGANLAGRDLSGRDLSGKDLSGANLAGAKLANANLSHSDLSGANLANADLSHAKLAGTDLSGANLSAARLVGLDFSGCDLSGSNLSQVEARDITAAHADLSGSNLKGIRLDGRDLSGSDFSGADLSGARLSGANLAKADLSGANLSNADLSHARMANADLSGANLNGTKLDGADLAGADVSGTKLDRSSSE